MQRWRAGTGGELLAEFLGTFVLILIVAVNGKDVWMLFQSYF